MIQQAIVDLTDTRLDIHDLVAELEEDYDVHDVSIAECYEQDSKYRLVLELDEDAELDRLEDIVHDLDIDIEWV